MNIYFVIVICLFIMALFLNSKKEENGFGNIGDILSIFNKGFSLTGGLRAISLELAYRNCLVVGPSGSGKTSTILAGSLNALRRGNTSIVVLDVSGEIYTMLSGYLSKYFKVYSIDFTETSDGFNPLSYCKNVSDIQKVASIIIKNSGTESKSDPYWSASAENIISIFLQYIVAHTDPEYHTLSNLVRMLETFAGEPEKIDRSFAVTNEDLLTAYKALVATPDRTLQSSLSTALVALKIFKNPEVARCSAISTFDFEAFRKEKSILFINTPITEVQFMAPYSALLFEQLFKVVLSRIPQKNECSIFAVLDEMITMKFQNLGLIFSNIRKYKGGCMGIVQDERMIEMAYSVAEAHAIRTNAYAKIYLTGQPHPTCKLLEEMIGKDDRHKPFISSSDIRILEEAIIIVGNHKPFKEKMIPFYNHLLLSLRTKIQPYAKTKKILFDEPPKLSFKK